MLTSLKLVDFKNFREATVPLGPLTVVLGTNAAGKSNLRDAFRFVHGISRGYTIPEIIGERWVEGGVLQWRGIRGGSREAAFAGNISFAIETQYAFEGGGCGRYGIAITAGGPTQPAFVQGEWLEEFPEGKPDEPKIYFDSHPDRNLPREGADDHLHLTVRTRSETRKGLLGPAITFPSHRPVLSQIVHDPEAKPSVREAAQRALAAFSSMRFLDLQQEAMRRPTFPGQTELGDQGENLSSVLQAICSDSANKVVLLEWLRELTPMDAIDFKFVPDQIGRILVTLVEGNGRETSAYSASDGTLRFLAMIAALLGPQRARFYFFEELENGIHPTRLHLLLELIERWTTEGGQLVATSHSPHLLALLSPEARADAVLVYRLEDEDAAKAIRVLDIPEARRVFETHDISRLLAAGWLENAVQLASPSDGEAR